MRDWHSGSAGYSGPTRLKSGRPTLGLPLWCSQPRRGLRASGPLPFTVAIQSAVTLRTGTGTSLLWRFRRTREPPSGGTPNLQGSLAGPVGWCAVAPVLLPVSFYFPGRSARWVADSCRAGRIPGAFKVGKAWFIRAADVELLGSSAPRGVPTVEDAAADLRRRGVL